MNDTPGNGRISDRRVRKTKKALRESLFLLMKQKNIRDISVQELSDHADINRATFYLHYKDIYDLQQQIEDEIIQEINAILDVHMPSCDLTNPTQLFVTLLQYINENAVLCATLLSDSGNHSFLNKLCTIVEKRCLNTWLPLSTSEENIDALPYFSSFIVYGYVSIISKWVTSGMQLPPEKLAAMMEEIGANSVKFLYENNA